MDSPQRHRQPYIEPLRFGGNIPIPPLPVNPMVGDDPFALPIGPVHFNGQQYGYLPQHLAQQVQNLPPLPLQGQGQGQGQLLHVSLILFFFKK